MIRLITFLFIALSTCGFAHPILEIVVQYIPENPNILEAGGQYGQDTATIASRWPKGKVYSFEPNPITFEKLSQVARSYPNITVFPYALYDYDGVTSFNIQHQWGNDGASSILPSANLPTHPYVDEKIQVPCITLDSWKDHPPIDFIWFDLEGVELQVLKAGTQFLKDVKVIYTETNFKEFRIGMTQFHDLDRFLSNEGFELIYHVGDFTLQGDALYVRKELLD